MSFLFSKGRGAVPQMPPLPPPAAIPQVGPEPGDWATRLAKRRAGFAKTILTGELQTTKAGKTLLGD